MSVSSLAFPYVQSENSPIFLNKVILTDEADQFRYLITLVDKSIDSKSSKAPRICNSISKINTATQLPTNDLITYIQNPNNDIGDIHHTPLLLASPPNFHKFKLNISIRTSNLANMESKSLIILKTVGNNHEEDSLKQYLDARSTTNNSLRIEISRLPYENFPLSQNDPQEYQKIIVNDSFNNTIFHDNKLNVSIWEETKTGDDVVHGHLFSFNLWINERELDLTENTVTSEHPEVISAPPKDNASPSTLVAPLIPPKDSKYEPKKDDLGHLNINNIRKAFTFNIEDGPEFRHSLQNYEKNLPIFKRNCYALADELKKLDSGVDRMMASKMKILDYISNITDLQAFRPLLGEIHFKSDFKLKFLKIFEQYEKDIKFFLNNVCDHKLLLKVISNIPPQDHNGSTGGPLSTSLSSTNTSPADIAKKHFENNSKEYYNWLNKYLSNERERPALKLLIKRKIFELSKFDYLNFLNLSTNNQYFNQLLENMFKYSSSPTMTMTLFKYELYLNILSRFNCEKLLLRQSIEACKSNEELTNIIRINSLNNPHHQSSSPSITSLSNIDTIFTNDFSLVNAIPIQTNGVDQNSNMAGILYALGGQGKQGWHKEWVVLKKGQLIEYSDWRKGKIPTNVPIEVALSNIKPTTNDKRKFCFEIMTSRGTKHVFQAINGEERDKWLKALYNAGQLVNTSRLAAPSLKPTLNNSSLKEKRTFLHALDIDNRSNKQPPPPKEDMFSPVSILAHSPLLKQEDVDYIKLIRTNPENLNHICSDCGLIDSVEWVSLNYLTVFCLKCSSGHRSLGSHISRIKSLKLDLFRDETALLLKHVSNQRANGYLEDNLEHDKKINSNSTPEERTKFIQQKYLNREFVTKFATFDELNDHLVRAIQKIDISETVKYISCGANIDMTISLNINKTEFIKVTLLEYSLRKFIEVKDTPPRKLFSISELLVLNGCKIDGLEEIRKEIGLSSEAIEYWKQRVSKLLGQ